MGKANNELTHKEKSAQLAKELTALQRKFVIELVKPNTSKRQAYIKAGGQAKKPETQDATASTMFRNAKVQAYYQHMINHKAQSSIMTRTEALERLSLSARIKITDICTFKYMEIGKDDNGPIMQTVWTMKNAEDIDPNVAACIKSVQFTNVGPKIELYDANGAIKQLATMEGWDAPKKIANTDTEGKTVPLNVNVNAEEIASALGSLLSKL